MTEAQMIVAGAIIVFALVIGLVALALARNEKRQANNLRRIGDMMRRHQNAD